MSPTSKSIQTCIAKAAPADSAKDSSVKEVDAAPATASVYLRLRLL